MPRMPPSTRPAANSRRITRHQSPRRTSPSASARMTSVEACEPELPPLEMISGTNSASTTACSISCSIRAHRRRRQHLAEEQRRQPAGALLNHPREADLHVGLVQRLGAAESLDVLGRLRFRHVQHVVDGDDADEHAGGVGHRKGGAIVRPKHADGRLLIVGRLQRDELAIHEVADQARRRGEQELANADVVDQQLRCRRRRR